LFILASNELAQIEGTYETYEGSPISKGLLQCDMWDVTPSNLWDWATLRENIKKHGVRNSLLVAPMPTASTSQILGNNEWCVCLFVCLLACWRLFSLFSFSFYFFSK